MSLKLAIEPVPSMPSTGPAWGELADREGAAHSLRFEIGDRSISFPIHALRRWELITGQTDVLMIAIDPDVITIEGLMLAPVRDALDASRVRVLRQSEARQSDGRTGSRITAIRITPEKARKGQQS